MEKINELDFKSITNLKKNFKVKWYRSNIEKNKFREFVSRNNYKGFFHAIGHLLLWLITGALSYEFFNKGEWLLFIISIFLHGTVGSFFGPAHHEFGHGTVFKSKRLNAIFHVIFSTLGLYNIHDFKISHTYHHLYTMHPEGDGEVLLPLQPSLRFILLFQLFTINFKGIYNKLSYFISTSFNKYHNGTSVGAGDNEEEWLRHVYEGEPKKRQKSVYYARYVLGFHVLVCCSCLLIGEPILIILITGHSFIANWLNYFVAMTMHCGLRGNVSDFRLNTRSVSLDPITEFLYWHMNWHIEHHMFPGVPFYNLKKLHNFLKDDMPKPRTLKSAWYEMRETWKRQQVENDYVYDTKIPQNSGNSEKILTIKKDLTTKNHSNEEIFDELTEMMNKE